MKISKHKIEIIKNLVIGFLFGTVVALWLTVVRLHIEKDSLEEMMEPTQIKQEIPKDYERANRLMPVVPTAPLTEEELLNLASMFPEIFTDEEIITLLIKWP